MLCVEIPKSSDVVAISEEVEGVSKWVGPSGLNLLIQQEAGGGGGLILNQDVLGRAEEEPTQLGKENPEGDILVVDELIIKKGKEVLLPVHIEASEDSISSNTLDINNEAHSSHGSEESHNSLHEVDIDVVSNIANIKKQVPRVKFPQGCGPKFLKLVEAVKEGGGVGQRRRQRGGEEMGRSRSVPASQRGRLPNNVVVQADVETTSTLVVGGESSSAVRNFHWEGLNLEVVLPGPVDLPATTMLTPVIRDSQGIQETPLS
jgi:hypothetical protein